MCAVFYPLIFYAEIEGNEGNEVFDVPIRNRLPGSMRLILWRQIASRLEWNESIFAVQFYFVRSQHDNSVPPIGCGLTISLRAFVGAFINSFGR